VSPPHGLSARNVIPATVQRLEQSGRALWVIVRAGDGEFVVELTQDAGRELGLRAGASVYIVAKSHSITVTRLQGEPNVADGELAPTRQAGRPAP